VQSRTWLSIVVPALNESANIVATLSVVQPWRDQGVEVIVVDGGSSDDTTTVAAALADVIVTAPRGRASQLQAGIRQTQGDVLLFLHADSLLPTNAHQLIQSAMLRGAQWGRFDVTILGRHPMLRVVASMMNLRSRLTGIATGDQGIFVARVLLDAIGGLPQQALMEDIELSKRLSARARPACLRARIATSGRRWEKHGMWRTIWLMWRLRFAYWRGANPDDLRKQYENPRPSLER
jgi:rSAM/selenodomain-associated transferase 2